MQMQILGDNFNFRSLVAFKEVTLCVNFNISMHSIYISETNQ